MKDLQIDFTNKKLINKFVDNKDRVIQQIRISINVWIQDWFIDETFGIDYDSCWENRELMGLYVKNQIAQVPGVQDIVSFSIETISSSDEVYFKIDTSIKFEGEVLDISEYIGI